MAIGQSCTDALRAELGFVGWERGFGIRKLREFSFPALIHSLHHPYPRHRLSCCSDASIIHTLHLECRSEGTSWGRARANGISSVVDLASSFTLEDTQGGGTLVKWATDSEDRWSDG